MTSKIESLDDDDNRKKKVNPYALYEAFAKIAESPTLSPQFLEAFKNLLQKIDSSAKKTLKRIRDLREEHETLSKAQSISRQKKWLAAPSAVSRNPRNCSYLGSDLHMTFSGLSSQHAFTSTRSN
jgi:hypothetical protein